MLDLIESRLPDVPAWAAIGLTALIVAAIAIAAALVVHWLAFRLLRRLAGASESEADDIVIAKVARPSRWALVALALVAAADAVPALGVLWERVGGIVLPLLIGWMVLAIFHALTEAMILRSDISVADNREARRRRTRLAIFNRIATFVIVFVTVGMMLLAIPGVRDIGVTLVASAGLAGLAVGAAAQPALKSLIAGFQMALTEPVIVGDAVVIGGEYGTIEDIRTTYVVVKLWDERRLVVPTSKFLDEIFQNWTKNTSQLLGTVLLYVDPATKLEPVREKFIALVEGNARWDGRVRHMQVTDLSRDAIEVRFLMSAKDAPTLFDLRCDIREALIVWLAEAMPEALVHSRVQAAEAALPPLEAAAAAGAESAGSGSIAGS